ncbi:hypothetical protein B0H11DRAFT_1912744 [Mycena galericulata]|nr:hypothetical protein B0H11DRAFT_1912744 [Mycena galericulata]
MKMNTDEIISRLGHAVDEARQYIGQLEQELVGARVENRTLFNSSDSSRINRLELSNSALQEELATVKQGRDHSCWHPDTSAYVVQQKCDEVEAQVKQSTEVLSSVIADGFGQRFSPPFLRRDTVKVEEMAQTERDGVMRHRWNGSAEREKLSAQRQVSKLRKTAIRNDQLNSYETLKAEREAGTNEHKASSERQRALESQIKSLQEEMKLDKHRTDLKEQVNDLRKDIEEEKALRRVWLLRRNQIDTDLNQLKAGPLAGVRIGGRRPAARPSGQADSGVATGHASIPRVASDLGEVDADPVNSIDGTEGAATAMVTEPDPRGVGPDAPVLPDDHELDSMESDYGLTADPNSNFSNELSRFEKTLFEKPPPFVDYFDMEELLPDFDPLAFNFDTIHADPAMSFQVLPAPEPTSSNLPVLPMPQPSPPFVAATIEEEIPALPTRKRSRQAEVDERNIVEGSRQRVKSRRAQGQL